MNSEVVTLKPAQESKAGEPSRRLALLALAGLTVAVFALANLRVGAQLTMVPAARYALALSVVLALVVVVQAFRPAVAKAA